MLNRIAVRTLPVALAVSFLAAGCTGSAPAPGDSVEPTGDAEAQVSEAATLMPVGPLEMDAAEFWSPGTTEGDVTTVTAGGCQDDAPCPGFAVITGETASGINPAEPYFDDGVACPVPGTTGSGGKLLSEHPSTVAGQEGTMYMFEVTCSDEDGVEQVTVPQNQWTLDTADGTIVIVDRWSFEGLLTKVSEATLTAEDA
ncbi:hypothetical protein [Demequina sediminicola]|uniref:hypothetical protein n=1 Tax=Demequina sediminicola TaxID=1095026 RepID=UPI000A93E0AB|nr:hypothetical protein [Demequina sediminicola]